MIKYAHLTIQHIVAATVLLLGCGGEANTSEGGDGGPLADVWAPDADGSDVVVADSPPEEDADNADTSPDSPQDGSGCTITTTCPSGRGPEMVIVPCVGGGSYCIDSTEVSRAQYSMFLADGFPLSGQPPSCSDNTSYQPDPSCDAQQEVTHQAEHPQVCIDWCDADAFCRWAGKRLCAGVWHEAGAERNEWYNACSTGGANTYCFGSTWNQDACNGSDHGLGTTSPVGSLASCEGGYPGLFDMSGNVSEWWDICSDVEPVECYFGGGSFISWDSYMECVAGTSRPLSHVSSTLGFRCCS